MRIRRLCLIEQFHGFSMYSCQINSCSNAKWNCFYNTCARLSSFTSLLGTVYTQSVSNRTGLTSIQRAAFDKLQEERTRLMYFFEGDDLWGHLSCERRHFRLPN